MATTPPPQEPSPQEFLSPVITSQLEKPLEDLDDFFLDEDEKKSEIEDQMLLDPPTSSTTETYPRPLIESSAESVWAAAKAKNASLSTSANQNVPLPKASPTQTYTSWNAVHMEVQGNAKLPTFNLNVNRSNSLGGLQIPAPRGRRSYGPRRIAKAGSAAGSAASSVSGSEVADTSATVTGHTPLSPIPKIRQNAMDPSLKLDNETSEAIDEILRLNENDMNLNEMFFDEDRSSAALAYSGGFSIPRSFDIPKIDSKSSLDGVEVATVKAAGIAPRPSETKMFYTRQKPLPIPGKPASPPMGSTKSKTSNSAPNTMAQAIATAAAIATTSDGAEGGQLDRSTAAALSVQPKPVSQVKKAPLPSSVVPKQATSRQTIIPPRPNQQQQSKTSTTSSHVPYQLKYQKSVTSSLAHAQAQRSSYGYGANHRVVGVPPPPPPPNKRGFPKHSTNSVKNHPVTGAPYVPIYTAPIPAVNMKTKATQPAKSPEKPKSSEEKAKKTTSVDTEDPAYERKKQRAKDARIRLNEAIEELGIAIELAGSQSRERLHNLTHLVPIQVNSSSVSQITPLQKVMIDTTTQAGDAKKWDRPSFVGLAATLIHSLNAQCEGLMREMLHLKRENEIRRRDDDRNLPEAGNVSPDASRALYGPCQIGSSDELVEPMSKRQKVGDNAASSIISGQTIVCNDTTVEDRRREVTQEMATSSKILGCVAQFLDPLTLCRCLCVSKQWISLDIFQNQQTWLCLCYKRFGTWSVRKWEGDEDDEDESSAIHASQSMDLYCRMVEGNVKPFSSMDGSIFLGGSTVDGLVSGWVSLVERSNGETSRSVMQAKDVDGKPHTYYSPIPVVELRILVQNTGYSNGTIHIPDQHFSVDASTRRKGEKLLELTSDDRFKRRVIHLEKTSNQEMSNVQKQYPLSHEMCELKMFEYAVLSVHIHARGCSTTSKFCHRGKNIQVLVSINGTTRPLVIPITGQS
eukprot:scaffold15972_cov73-Cyclotella_meneghiniana.AAC.1